MVVVTNKPIDPENKIKCKPEEPENVVRITENPLQAKPYMKVEPPREVHIHDDDEAIRFFAKAHESCNCAVAEQCVNHLKGGVDNQSLVKVLGHYCALEPYAHEGSVEPSAPPIYEDGEQVLAQGAPENSLNDALLAFLERCLDRFDANAVELLKLPSISTISRKQMLSILTRDTFAVPNEQLVYVACVRWAQEHTKTSTDVRLGDVMQDLKYAPRYGLMTLCQFTQASLDGVTGVKKGGVLTEKEYKECKKYIKDKGRCKKVEELKCNMSRPRNFGANRLSVSSERTKLDKCIMYTLICFTAIFD